MTYIGNSGSMYSGAPRGSPAILDNKVVMLIKCPHCNTIEYYPVHPLTVTGSDYCVKCNQEFRFNNPNWNFLNFNVNPNRYIIQGFKK